MALALVAITVGWSPPPAAAAEVNSLLLTATYDVEATLDWSDRTLTADTTAHVTNTGLAPVAVVALNLAPLRTGRAQVDTVAVDGRPVEAPVEDQTILVPLPSPLAVGGSAAVRVAYSARLNAAPDPASDEWTFARAADVLTAYRWIPWLSRQVPFDAPSVGEKWVTPISPEVRVRITADRPLVYATSGRPTTSGGLSQAFVATGVRDFNFSASPSYRAATRDVAGTTITFMHIAASPDRILDLAAAAFADFRSTVGDYPHSQLTIAEIGPWAGLESPSLMWLPSNAEPRLTPWIVSHEVAHQWFYAAVGSDQARDPFADEALADFMARDLLARWVDSRCAPDRLDQSIYDLGECYPWVIYVQGVAYLRAYRDRVGNAAFWEGVAGYYAAYRDRIGGTRALLDALDGAAGQPAAHWRRFPGLYPPLLACGLGALL